MPQFHETGYGRSFFEHQLPQLIKALNRVADALTPVPPRDPEYFSGTCPTCGQSYDPVQHKEIPT